jgi:hypothetical protein
LLQAFVVFASLRVKGVARRAIADMRQLGREVHEPEFDDLVTDFRAAGQAQGKWQRAKSRGQC